MAIFSSNTGINSIQDKSVRNYLIELNENLTYMFQNLTPEDNNAASVPKLTYVEDGTSTGRFEISSGGIIAELTDESNVIAKINMSTEGISIIADKISIEGLITANENFWIDEDGNMGAKNGTFSGAITASTITGGTILIKKGTKTVCGFDTSGECKLGAFKIYISDTSGADYFSTNDESVGMGDHNDFAFWAGGSNDTPPFRVTSAGKIYCSDMGSAWSGYSVGEAIEWIWDNWPG